MPSKKTRNKAQARRNRAYELRQQKKGMIRISVWVPEDQKETFRNAALTYTRLHMEKLERLKPSA